MMNDKNLDDYLRAYRSETDQSPSRQLVENILAVSNNTTRNSRSFIVHPWQLFDSMMPKAVGWALTCCLGIYIGLSSPEQGITPMDEEYYMYDQVQIRLSEDMGEGLNLEDID